MSVLNAMVTFVLFEHYCYLNKIFKISVENTNNLKYKNKILGLNVLIRLSLYSNWGILAHSPMCLIIHLRIFELHSISICIKNCISVISAFSLLNVTFSRTFSPIYALSIMRKQWNVIAIVSNKAEFVRLLPSLNRSLNMLSLQRKLPGK